MNHIARENSALLIENNEWRSNDKIVAYPYCKNELNDFPVIQAKVKKFLEDGFNHRESKIEW